MVYQVLARKYRPQTFEDVAAQDHVTKTLRNAVANGRVSSGYLFCGPRGTGKTTTARILAKALNCVEGPTPVPCGECSSCKEIAAGSSMDVLEIDAASNTGVDDVRALRENVKYLPTSGKKRIFIIDEVHRLSGAAFDALLKTLEEPPAHVVFVFATTEPMKVPETILSRTQRFDFKRVSVTDLAVHLNNICDREKLAVDDVSIKLLARKADGSVRDSLSLLDQVAAFAGTVITEKDVVEALGLVDRKTLFDLSTAVASQDKKAVLNLIRNVITSGTDARDFLTELIDHLRILMLLSVDREVEDVVALSDEEHREYEKQAEFFSTGDIVRLIKMTGDLLGDLRGGLDEQLVLELGALKMATMESTVHFEDILRRLNQEPNAGGSPGADLFGRTEKKSEVGSSRPEPDNPGRTFAPSRTVNLPQIQSGWPDFLSHLKSKSSMLASQLAMAGIKEFKDQQLIAVFGNNATTSLQVVSRPDNYRLIQDLLRQHFQAAISITFEKDPNTGRTAELPGEKQLPKNKLDELVKNSPRLQMLMEKVDGEVIGVKQIKQP